MERKTEHPILFSTPMVQAILEGRKTMTRRILKVNGCKKFIPDGRTWNKEDIMSWTANGATCPYGQKGDKLWVRETFVPIVICDFDGEGNDKYTWIYKADDYDRDIIDNLEDSTWKPSIHMPKAAARIWLEITNIRVERLHDISEEDAKSEGLEFLDIEDPYTFGFKLYGNHSHLDILGRKALTGTAIESFQSLWESINGVNSWNENPWVWVVEFKRIDPCQ